MALYNTSKGERISPKSPSSKKKVVHPDAATLKRAAVHKRSLEPHTSPLPLVSVSQYRKLYRYLNRVSNGKAEEVVRILSFLVIGGSASVINLFFTGLFTSVMHLERTYPAWTLTIVATEISLLYNFFLNDRYTFHSMLDASRTWLQRCIRFHGPASVGFGLTLAIFSFNHYVLGIRPVISQAIAIAIVTVVNFVMHRYWTFRPKSTTTKAMGRVA
jgi:putative flippase GtrA